MQARRFHRQDELAEAARVKVREPGQIDGDINAAGGHQLADRGAQGGDLDLPWTDDQTAGQIEHCHASHRPAGNLHAILPPERESALCVINDGRVGSEHRTAVRAAMPSPVRSFRDDVKESITDSGNLYT